MPSRLPALLLVVLLVTAGCSSLGGNAVTGSDVGPTTDDGSPTRGDTADTPTTPGPETTRCHCAMNGRFELHEGYRGNVTVTVFDVTGDAPEHVTTRTFTDRFTVYDFDPVMRYGHDYLVRVHVDGRVAWNETISRSEGYRLRVHENGTASVSSHAIV